MPRFEIRQTETLNLTSYSGLALIGQCFHMAQVDAVIDPKIPVSQGMRTSDIVKSAVGLLSLGKSDFEAIEPFLDNSCTKKEDVSRTYKGFDGYTPIAAYLGNEGWSIGLELRPGARHSAHETHFFYERLFPRIERLVKPKQPVLLRGACQGVRNTTGAVSYSAFWVTTSAHTYHVNLNSGLSEGASLHKEQTIR